MRKDLGQKIVIVTRKTRLDELTRKFNTKAQAKFYITRSRENFAAQRGATVGKRGVADRDTGFGELENEHTVYQAALEQLRQDLDFGVKCMVLDRSYLANFVFGPEDIVVTLGQDGLVANTAKYALGLPIVAVNPDPDRIDGILLPFGTRQAGAAVRNVLNQRAKYREVTMAEARLNDGQTILAFNDLFVGNRTHVSARYRLEIKAGSEAQSSSGVLVSTGAGSTGWLSSVFNMAAGVSAMVAGGKSERHSPLRMGWEDPRLMYVVREPFVSKSSRASLVAGMIDAGEEAVVESQMPENGVIFSDGIEADYLAFNSGAVARIAAAKRRARLVVSS